MDFEAHAISDNDFHGIKTLLQQVLLSNMMYSTKYTACIALNILKFALQQRLKWLYVTYTHNIHYLYMYVCFCFSSCS